VREPFESNYEQSLAIMDTRTGKVMDFPDARTGATSKETLYSGLAFSRDGKHVYASMASLTLPTGDGGKNPGNGIAVYRFVDGKITPERFIPIGMQKLAGNRRTALGVTNFGEAKADRILAIPYPAAIAVIDDAGSEQLLVANNLSDNVLLLDAATGKVITRFDLSESDSVPGTYPIALAVDKAGTRAFVALWNASEVVELNLKTGTVGRKVSLLKPANPANPGSHPCALEISPDGKTLYVALSNRDAVAAVNVARRAFSVKGYFDTRLPGQSYFGAEPDALALSANGAQCMCRTWARMRSR
jgi:DNA-binding beta-propeller fold protein YncE